MPDDPVTPRADRDPQGRFAPGNRLGRGNPHLRRFGALQQAIRDAIGTVDLKDVLRAMRDRAKAGDAQAAAVLLGHVLGRPRERDPDVDIDLPADLATADGIVAGLVQITRAAAAGEVPADVAERLSALLGRVADATVIRDLTARIDQLEAHRAHRGPAGPSR